MMVEAALLITALLFGGMALYSFGFAAFLFRSLPAQTAGPLLRKAFPHFYLFVIITSFISALLLSFRESVSAIILAIIVLTAVLARQVIMPAVNEATDTEAKTRFKLLHGLSVVITLAHIGAAGYVIIRLAALA